MKTTTPHVLLKQLPLSPEDAARLILECTEELGVLAAGCNRLQLLRLIRKTLQSGAETMALAQASVSLKEAVASRLEAAAHRRPATRRDLRHFTNRMLRVEGAPAMVLRRMTTEDCRRILQTAFHGSIASFRKGRAILHSLFSYGRRQGWCDANPVEGIGVPPLQERAVAPLGLEEIRRLQEAAEQPEHRAMRFSLHLMLYCGVRPAEVQRICPATDINWEDKTVFIRPCASKTGGGRLIPLRAGSKALQGEFSIPRNWEIRWRALRRSAGFMSWSNDVLRHTFASYHALYFRNLPALQVEMGHRDLMLLRSRYINPIGISRQAAQVFWQQAGRPWSASSAGALARNAG